MKMEPTFEDWGATGTTFSFLVPIGKRGRQLRFIAGVEETRNIKQAESVMAEILEAKKNGTINEYLYSHSLPDPEIA